MNSRNSISSNPFSTNGTGYGIGSKRPPPLLSSPTFTPKQMQFIQPPDAFKATPCPLLKYTSSALEGPPSMITISNQLQENINPSKGTPKLAPSPISRAMNESPIRLNGELPETFASDMSQLSLRKENEKKISFIPTGSGSSRLSLTGNNSANAALSTNRRASVATPQIIASRPSLGGGGGSSSVGPPPPKDPRPTREKAFQFSCIKSLIKFLTESGYDRPLSPKLLSSPSAKDFASIFKFLYAQLDPTFMWTPEKKFEEEVPLILKSLSKSHLYAVGSMHAWPGLLAMLQWMVDLILCCDQLQTPFTPSTDPSVVVSELTIDAVNGSKISVSSNFNYLSSAYRLFLSGDEHYELLQAELNSHFVLQTSSVEKETEMINNEISALDRELGSLESRETANEQKAAAELRETLIGMIGSQLISPEDAEKYLAEKENLAKGLAALKASRIEWEILISEYNSKVEKLHLGNLLLRRISDITAKPLLSINLRLQAVPTIHALQESILSEYQLASKHVSAKSEAVSLLKDTIVDKREELSRMEERIRKTEIEYTTAKNQYAAENLTLAAEIDHLEAELLKIRSETATGYLASQQNLQRATLEYDQLVAFSSDEREKCAKEVFSSLEQCISLKSHIESVFSNFDKWLSSLAYGGESGGIN